MNPKSEVFIGTDSGATTSKTCGVWADGSTVTTKLLQSSTNSQAGTEAVVRGWVQGVNGFLAEHHLSWDQVRGVGLAIPGPYLRYGVLGRAANLPASFEGWDFRADYAQALAAAAGRPVEVTVGNDGKLGGVAEARVVRGDKRASVLMLAPGSGLGCAYIGQDGRPLDGDNLVAMEAAHIPAPLHLLGVPAYPCGCGRTWGCAEVYTTLSGLSYLLADKLKEHPEHELARSSQSAREKALSLRGRAQAGDPLAIELFDFQARALGLHAAVLAITLDPSFVVIGGGLMDPESTTPQFRERYLGILRAAAMSFLWPTQRASLQFVPASLGELSQAVGAALVARYAAGSAA